MEHTLIKLVLLAVCGAWIAAMELVDEVSQSSSGAVDLFRYSVPFKLVSFGAVLSPLLVAKFAWKLTRARTDVVIALLAIPLFAYIVWPHVLTARVEVSDTHLVNYRDFISPECNLEIPFRAIKSGVETNNRQPDGSITMSGYRFQTHEGSTVTFEVNSVLYAARYVIRKRLGDKGIPLQILP